MASCSAEILIVTALELERAAVVRQMSGQHEQFVSTVPCCYGEVDGAKLAVACFHAMGNVDAAAKTATLVHAIAPRLVILVGIAGGTDRPTSDRFSADDHFLGDVMLAEQVVDYESGKVNSDKTEHRFRAFPVSNSWLSVARSMKSEDWIHEISEERPDGSTGRTNPQAHCGTFASGEKVIKSNEFAEALKDVWTQLVAVEMESLGVAVACHQTSPPTEFLVVKAICDWADPDKNDSWQSYAADAAASYSIALVKKCIAIGAGDDSTQSRSGSTESIPTAKLAFIQRLGGSWKDLCDALSIPRHERDRFEAGDEPRGIWEWLETRNRLPDLPPALQAIARKDLADILPNP